MQPADVVGDDKYTRSTGTIIPHHNFSLEILLNELFICEQNIYFDWQEN